MDSHLHLFISDHGCLFDSKKDAMGKLEAFFSGFAYHSRVYQTFHILFQD